MRKKTFLWISALVLAAVATGSLIAFSLLSSSIKASATENLKAFSEVAIDRYFGKLEPAQAAEAILRESGIRATLIDQDGSVVADSGFDPSVMDNHLIRPEVKDALKNGSGTSSRYSETASEQMLYYAFMLEDGRILRLSVPLLSVSDAARSQAMLIIALTALLATLGLIASYAISGGITSKMDSIVKLSQSLATGDFSERMPEGWTGPEAKLSASFNLMAEALSENISDLTRQKAELNGILTSISDGILFVDADLKLIMINKLAAKLLGMKGDAAYGRYLLESVRATELGEALRKSVMEAKPVQLEYAEAGGSSVLEIKTAPVRLEDGYITGAVASIRDVSGPKKLEMMRSEFVANVTHELKTPLTSIKGFAQTLVGEEDQSVREKFLRVIETEADRMSKLVDDIIALSEIETVGAGDGETGLSDEIRAAVDMIIPISQKKEISIEIEVEDGIMLKASPPIIRRLLVNLVDNAVKYTEKDGKVHIRAKRKGRDVLIEVRDNGIGISPEDQKRVFERFYRVDKSRSRELGGTGLGLAIVKHIAKSLGGEAAVISELGKGSTFTVTIPAGESKT